MNIDYNKETIYALATESFGIVPGVIKEMAERSGPLAYMYLQGVNVIEKSSFTELEINAIELRISSLNKCQSCIKRHSFLAKKAGLSDADIQSLLRGEETTNDRLNILLQTAEYIYYSGAGTFSDIAMDFIETNKVTEREVFEIIGLLSLKTISNYVNNYLETKKLVKASA